MPMPSASSSRAPISATLALSCLRSALADEVIAIGGIEAAQQECGTSDDTVRRRLAGTHGWTDKDIAAMIAAGHARLGRSLPVERLVAMLAAGPSPAGDGRRAVADVVEILPGLLAQAQALAAAVKDRRVNRAEARALLAGMPEVEHDLALLRADLTALLRDEART